MNYNGHNTEVLLKGTVAELRWVSNGDVLATFDMESGKLQRDESLIGETAAWKLMLYSLIFQLTFAAEPKWRFLDLMLKLEKSRLNTRGFTR